MARWRRVRAGLQAAAKSLGLAVPPGYPDYLLHTRWVRRGARWRGSEDVQARRQLRTLRDLIDWSAATRRRFFLASRKADTEFAFDVDLALSQSEDNPSTTCSTRTPASARCWRRRHRRHHPRRNHRPAARPLAARRRARTGARRPVDAVSASACAMPVEELAPHQVAFYLKDLGGRIFTPSTMPNACWSTTARCAMPGWRCCWPLVRCCAMRCGCSACPRPSECEWQSRRSDASAGAEVNPRMQQGVFSQRGSMLLGFVIGPGGRTGHRGGGGAVHQQRAVALRHQGAAAVDEPAVPGGRQGCRIPTRA